MIVIQKQPLARTRILYTDVSFAIIIIVVLKLLGLQYYWNIKYTILEGCNHSDREVVIFMYVKSKGAIIIFLYTTTNVQEYTHTARV